MVSRFEYHGKESLMEKRRQRRKEQLRNRTVALAAGLLLAGVCGVSSALAATGGSDGFDVVDVLQDTASLSAAPSSLVPAEDDALWQVAAEGGSDAALKEIASRGANLLAARSGGQRAVEGMRITTALIKVEGVLDQNLANDSSFSVDFNKQFTLHTEVESELNLANKKVEITVPDGLTVVEYPIPERGDMAESVTPESIDQLHSVNNYGGYHPTNGTITYSLKNTAEKNSFNIVLAPDTVLWNRTKEQELKDSLKIEVYTGDRTYQTISATPKITGKYNDTPSDNRAIQTGPRLSRIGVKTGVPTAANQPFALRQIWINPDKDYIDMPQFFKKLELTIALPYYTENGNNIYAKLDHITWDPAGESTRLNLLDPENHKGGDDSYKDGFNFTKTVDDANHTVKLTWENLYLEYAQDYFTPYFKWTSDCDITTTNAVRWGSDSILNTGKTAPGCYEGKTPTTGDASAVGGTITWQDDSTWYLYNGDCTTLSFTAQAGESMSVNGKANNQPIYNNYASDSNIIYYLGQFHVVNQGGAVSANKTVEFTYGNNDKIGVTAQKIPATTGNVVEVWYTTTTNPTEQKYNGTLISSGGFVAFTTQMAGLGKGEYFTKIKANVGSYEKDYVGYVSSRDQDPTSGYATTFGKLLTADEATYSNFASMKMYDTGSGDSTAKSGNYTVKVTNTRGEIPLAMEQAYEENSLERVPILSKTSATAGETITFNGLLSSSAYPYSSNNITTDQEIYIRLPEKITVKNLKLYQEVGRMADKVFLLDAVTETVTSPQRTEIAKDSYSFVEVTSAAETGYKLYKITFMDADNPAKVGWFTDGLGQYQIGISFDMEIAKDADAMTLDMRDCVRFKSASLTSTSNNGTLAQYQVMDDRVRYSTFNVNAKGAKLSVVAARLGLTFTFGARMLDKSNTEPDYDAGDYSNFEEKGDKVYLKDADHVVDMLFTLKNETGRVFSKDDAQAFYYFIPVPKEGDFWDSHMQDKAFDFDMMLTGEPTLSGASAVRNHIQVTYSTKVDASAAPGDSFHYSTVTNDNYVTAEKITNWGDVKMIRIAATSDTESIPEDADLKVNLRLSPKFDSSADLVGSVVNFGPCGVSPYSVGSTLNQGHNPLSRIQVEFQTGVIEGKVFIDKDFDGVYTEDADDLYTGKIKVSAPHQNGVGADDTESHETITETGVFKFTGRRADTYHVIVANPGSSDANGDNPLKFSLPESGGAFGLGDDETTATATVTLEKGTGKGTADLAIGLQQPHTVSFSAENATLSASSTKVWHNDALKEGIPTVTASSGWRFTGNWTDEATTYTTDQLKEQVINADDKTFAAEVKKLYSVTYDLNGGTGAGAPETTQHVEGEKVSPNYTGTSSLNKGEKTIFVGWSLEKIADVLQEDATQETIGKIISTDQHDMPDHDVHLYAVYAMDANGNSNPDYNDDAVHVRYHGNNGDYTDIICPHHHVIGAKEQLSTNGAVSGKSLGHDDDASSAAAEVKNHTFTYGTNIFVGWSTTPILDRVIKTKADHDDLKDSIVTEVTMLSKPGADVSADDAKDTSKYADADGNTNVYAVWAADRNGNKVADYTEEYQLTYEANARDGDTVGAMPTISGAHIPSDKVTLSDAKPTHSDVDGKKVVFIGWTETQTNSIFGRADEAPATVTEVTFGAADKTVYAAWGYDEDDDGVADALETYSLIYDLNGGSGTPPAQVSNIAKGSEVKLTTEAGFRRNANELFVGWSATEHEDAFTAAQKEELKQALITGTSVIFDTADRTLYAVWAADRNGNHVADYQEPQYKINYDGNAQSGGSIEGLPSDSEIHLTSETVTLSTATPIYHSADGKSIAFLGWTERPAKILSRSDDEPTLVTSVAFDDADKTVYAAWGYDDNRNNVADVLETYSLSYDLNGGVGSAPAGQTDIRKGTPVPLTSDTGFSRQPRNPDGITEIFAGWSRAKHEDAFTAEQRDEAKKALVSGKIIMGTEDLTLYAVWAQDRNNSGVPDFSETSYKIIYDGNAQENGTVKGLPVDEGLHLAGDTVSLGSARPTHSGLNGKEVVFLGWTLSRVDGIFDHEAAPTSADEGMARDGAASHAYVNSVELVDADVTVYAAWGYQEHVWGDWAVETPSTCVQQGTEKRTCTTCDAVERRPLDVLPHEWEANFTVDKPVTCVEDGLKSNHCKHCGATRYATPIPSVGHVFGGWKADAAGHWRECTVCNVKAAAGAHEFREVMADDGRRHEVCSVCGYDREKQAILPATDGASAANGRGGSSWFQTLIHLPQTGDPQGWWVVVLLVATALGAGISVVAFGRMRRLARGRHAK